MIVPGSDHGVGEAVRLLRKGGLIAFPTETYYGLGVDPFNRDALQRLFAVKRRAADKPVLVLAADTSHVLRLAASIPPGFTELMERFWPGPLTLVFPARPDLPRLLTGGTGTVGIRQSPHAVAAEIVAQFSAPVTATSANRSGAIPATTAAEVEAVFGAEVDLILDGGRTPGGKGSTLVGFTDNGLICLREGKISFSQVDRTVVPP